MSVLKFPGSNPKQQFIELMNSGSEFVGLVVDESGVGRIAWSCEDALRIIGMLETIKTLLALGVGDGVVKQED